MLLPTKLEMLFEDFNVQKRSVSPRRWI